MKNNIVAAMIIGASILVSISLYIYFSPYQSCMRNYQKYFLYIDKANPPPEGFTIVVRDKDEVSRLMISEKNCS